MFLYHQTLKEPTRINTVIIGNFSGTKTQELVVSKTNYIELLRPDLNTGKVVSILTRNIFGVIRSLAPFRIIGGTKDYIVVGSESGCITVLEYNPKKNIFDLVHQETFGKSGCRRVVAGQYLTSDPRGRAVMIGAVEKQKLVYILNRDSNANLTINSPLEANKPNTVCFSLVGVDVGYENPIFAALECEYPDDHDDDAAAQQDFKRVTNLVYYELDLGLNHVVRKWSENVEVTANMLIALPGGIEGPSGVLVCSENKITWIHQDSDPISISVPRRPGNDQNYPTLIVSSSVHKLKKGFFILVQNEFGDLFKVTVDYTLPNPDGTGGSGVTEIRIKYFDTVPTSVGMCIFKAGFIYFGCESGNHKFYQIENLGDDDEQQIEYSSSETSGDQVTFFQPRPLRNLDLVDDIESLSPLVHAKVLNLDEDETPQIYALCGSGHQSSLKIVRRGVPISELAVSELPGIPTNIWTLRLSSQEEFDSYIVVSFSNATLVLSIGETVEEITDSGLLTSSQTLMVGQLGEDSLVQVYAQGIRHIRSNKRISEWRVPAGRSIIRADCNHRQVAIGLSSAEIVYFELDANGNLNEYQEKKEMTASITCMSIGHIPEGRLRSRYMVVGCSDNTVRLISLDPKDCLSPVGLQALNATPESCCIANISGAFDSAATGVEGTYLFIGLQNGVLIRSSLDEITGSLTDARMKFLGTKPVQLCRHKIGQSSVFNSVFSLSSKAWLTCFSKGRLKNSPISYTALDRAATFHSEQCPNGIVSVSSNSLRILSLDNPDQDFNTISIPLRYTPRKFDMIPGSSLFAIIESQPRTPSGGCFSKDTDAMEEEQEELDRTVFGHDISLSSTSWASCIKLLDISTGESSWFEELEKNEAALSILACQFASSFSPEQNYLIVGTSKKPNLSKYEDQKGLLKTYRFIRETQQMSLVHTTEVEGIPTAMCTFQGKVLVAINNFVRIYDLGKKKLLRKCENNALPNRILTINTQGNRIVMTDIQESVFYADYSPQDNKITVFADDVTPRWVTASCMLDYDTVVTGDKFGNIFVGRLPNSVSEQLQDDLKNNQLSLQKGQLHGAPHKIEKIVEFHVGDVITFITKTSLIAGGREVILYGTLGGSLGIFVPFITKDEAEFFQTLELQLRQTCPPLLGRDHLAYRSAFIPSKNVVDGDLCQFFTRLAPEKRREIAGEFERSTADMIRKLEDIVTRSAF